MLFRDYKKAYVEFCEEEILREIALARRRYLRKEKKRKYECTLNETAALGSDEEKVDMLMGDEDVMLEDFLPLKETVEDVNIADNLKLLSDKEQRVVSFRLEKDMSVKQINIIIGTERPSTSSDIFQRAIKKVKNNLEDKKGE